MSALMSDTVVSFKMLGTNSCPSPFIAPGDFEPEKKIIIEDFAFLSRILSE